MVLVGRLDAAHARRIRLMVGFEVVDVVMGGLAPRTLDQSRQRLVRLGEHRSVQDVRHDDPAFFPVMLNFMVRDHRQPHLIYLLHMTASPSVLSSPSSKGQQAR